MKLIKEIKNLKLLQLEKSQEEINQIQNVVKVDGVNQSIDPKEDINVSLTIIAVLDDIKKDHKLAYRVNCNLMLANDGKAIEEFNKYIEEESNTLTNNVITSPLFKLIRATVKAAWKAEYEINNFYSISTGK